METETLAQIKSLKAKMSLSVIGQGPVIDRILIALLTDGNLLLEGLPGLAKTRAVKSLATYLHCKLSRIQFTPDLLPSDITGTEIYQPDSEEKFLFQPGPIFSNLVLADEINRAPAKVQAALLEAMEERQVSVAGKTYKMAPLFMVLATQNPIEQEGTYPLPEAQLDRFVMKVLITYPSVDAEKDILRMLRAERKGEKQTFEPIPQEVIFRARSEINSVTISEAAEQYIVDLINATRYPEMYGDNLKHWIQYGASPRGTISLERCAKVVAWLDGRDYLSPDDIRAIAHDVLRHRLVLSYLANAERITADQVIDEVLKNVLVA
ncbi:MoxR family ATPase [Limibacter armeniacum]|uniref:AAA family ATPase n=1 Tax=Limibacter armeniacum TaxID=466084 RepID=UPI002FE61044